MCSLLLRDDFCTLKVMSLGQVGYIQQSFEMSSVLF